MESLLVICHFLLFRLQNVSCGLSLRDCRGLRSLRDRLLLLFSHSPCWFAIRRSGVRVPFANALFCLLKMYQNLLYSFLQISVKMLLKKEDFYRGRSCAEYSASWLLVGSLQLTAAQTKQGSRKNHEKGPRHRQNVWKSEVYMYVKGRRKDKGRCFCLGERIYSISCHASS